MNERKLKELNNMEKQKALEEVRIKTIKTILSCKTKEQVKAAIKYVKLAKEKYRSLCLPVPVSDLESGIFSLFGYGIANQFGLDMIDLLTLRFDEIVEKENEKP